jgi:hypothetical protein
MANEIKLEVYTFKIKERYKKVYLNLDAFFGANDFLKFFEKFIKSFSSDISIDDKQKKSLQFVSEHISVKSVDRMISGIVESGDYGTESKIVSSISKKTAYNKKDSDLDIKPFYFLIHAPKGQDTGLMILQRIGGFGINGILTRHICDFFSEDYADFICEFSPFLSKSLANELIAKNSIKELKLRRYGLPKDIIDKLQLTGHGEEILSVEIKIVAKKNNVLPFGKNVRRFVKNPNTAFFDIPELKKLGFDGNNKCSIKVRDGKNVRTVDLKESLQLRPYYDIDKKVDKKRGNPVFKSIDALSKELIIDLQNERDEE